MHLSLIDSLHMDHLVYFVAEVYRFCIARMDLPFIYINLTSIHSNDDERILAHSCLSTNALLVEKSHTFTSLRRTWSINKTATLATFIPRGSLALPDFPGVETILRARLLHKVNILKLRTVALLL